MQKQKCFSSCCCSVHHLQTPHVQTRTLLGVSPLRLGTPACYCDEAAGGGEAAGTGNDPPPPIHTDKHVHNVHKAS